jgi:prophage regulatory protein
MKVLRLKDVIQIVGLSRSSIYGLKASGSFPKSFMLGARAVGWSSDDIESWLNSRITNSVSRG